MPAIKLCENKKQLLALTLWQAMTYGIYLAVVYKIELPRADEEGKKFFTKLFTNDEDRDKFIDCLVQVEGKFEELADCAYPLIRDEMLMSHIQGLALSPLIYLSISLVTALTIYGGYKACQLITAHNNDDALEPCLPRVQQSRTSDTHQHFGTESAQQRSSLPRVQQPESPSVHEHLAIESSTLQPHAADTASASHTP